MPSIIPGYDYDIFISYRQKDNQSDQWVTKFIESLKEEINATFKEDISIYFDENPHDGLHEHHEVDDSLREKLKCLIFIPIVSQTYCDPKCFAWEHEFKVFVEQAGNDQFGLKTKLLGGNVASRVLPVKIHDLDSEDVQLFESETGGVMRSIDFIYKDTGVNRPLKPDDHKEENLNNTRYRDQINKVANAIKEIISALKEDPSKVVLEEQSQPTLEVKEKPRDSRKILIGFVILFVLLFVLYFIFGVGREKNEALINTETIDKSIAVLPFVNKSDDPDQLYFSDGIMEAILNHLNKIKDLKVTLRTSVMQYRNTEKTIPQIARELGVAYILEGGVQRFHDQVRINAQLIDAKTDKQVWSENYDREFTNIFAIQSEVAQQIANILQATIDTEVIEQLESKPTENMEAYNLYLEALFILNNFFGQTDYPKAYELLEKAVALDPDFALAYTRMADYWTFQGIFTGVLEMEEVLKEALPLLEKSLELDDKEPDTHESLAYIYLYFQWDFEKAEVEFNKIRELSPSFVINPDYFLASGRYQEALVESTKRIKYDMNNPAAWSSHGLSLYFNDHAEESLATLERALKKFPNDPFLLSETGRVFIFLNEYNKAIKILEPHLNKIDRRPPRDLGFLAISYYKTNQNSKSNDLLEEIKQMSQGSSVGSPAFYIAMLYAQMGEIDLAFEWLDKAYTNHEVEMYWLKVEPPFEPLKSDPRWQEMLDKVGFP